MIEEVRQLVTTYSIEMLRRPFAAAAEGGLHRVWRSVCRALLDIRAGRRHYSHDDTRVGVKDNEGHWSRVGSWRLDELVPIQNPG